MSVMTPRAGVPTNRTGAQFVRPIPRKRPTFPKFRTLDGVWIAVLALLPNLVNLIPGMRVDSLEKWEILRFHYSYFLNSPIVQLWISTISYSLIPPVVYISFLKNRDRNAALIASAFCATSIFIIRSAHEAPMTALYTLILLVAFAFVNFDIAIPGALLFAAATILRPESVIFVTPIFFYLLLPNRGKAILALIVYLALTGAYFLSLVIFGHGPFELIRSQATIPWLAAWATTPVFLSLWWFIFPFTGEITNADSRRMYLPTLLFTAIYLIFSSVYVHTKCVQTLLPITPFLYILVAAGIARLIPTIAGDIRGVGFRYATATIAAISLIAIGFTQQLHEVITINSAKQTTFQKSDTAKISPLYSQKQGGKVQ